MARATAVPAGAKSPPPPPPPPDPELLDRQFFALSDATRRRMLDQLGAGPASVSALVEPLGIAMPSAVKHLAVLEGGGLVASEKSGRVRTYRIVPAAFAAMEQWVAQRKTDLNAQFDRLEAYLAADAAKAAQQPPPSAPPPAQSRKSGKPNKPKRK
jgi:DNA-binding transcriptional ArsR family regulator